MAISRTFPSVKGFAEEGSRRGVRFWKVPEAFGKLKTWVPMVPEVWFEQGSDASKGIGRLRMFLEGLSWVPFWKNLGPEASGGFQRVPEGFGGFWFVFRRQVYSTDSEGYVNFLLLGIPSDLIFLIQRPHVGVQYRPSFIVV